MRHRLQKHGILTVRDLPRRTDKGHWDGRGSSDVQQQRSKLPCIQDWESAKVRQDKALDNIERGLGVLKGLGEAMGENLNQQDVLLTEIDSKARNAEHWLIYDSIIISQQCQMRDTFLTSVDGHSREKFEDQQHEAQGHGDSGGQSSHAYAPSTEMFSNLLSYITWNPYCR